MFLRPCCRCFLTPRSRLHRRPSSDRDRDRGRDGDRDRDQRSRERAWEAPRHHRSRSRSRDRDREVRDRERDRARRQSRSRSRGRSRSRSRSRDRYPRGRHEREWDRGKPLAGADSVEGWEIGGDTSTIRLGGFRLEGSVEGAAITLSVQVGVPQRHVQLVKDGNGVCRHGFVVRTSPRLSCPVSRVWSLLSRRAGADSFSLASRRGPRAPAASRAPPQDFPTAQAAREFMQSHKRSNLEIEGASPEG